MMAKRNKAAPTRSGSRTMNYVLIGLFAVLVLYFVVLPAFTPHSPAGQTTTTTSPAYKVSLGPSTDIAGTMVTVTGETLPAGSNVTVSFDSAQVGLTNGTGSAGCTTSSSGSLSSCNFWVPLTAKAGSHNVTITVGNATASVVFTVPQYAPPFSTILVTLTSVSLGLITQLVTKRVVDLNKERRMRAEGNAINKEKREATVANDKSKLEKLKKREVSKRTEQAKVSTARLKVTAITFIPLLVVYYLMATFLGGYGVIVAYSPVPIPVITAPTLNPAAFELSLFWWYFLSSFTFSTMLTRLLHTNP